MADAVGATPSPQEKARVEARPTDNPAAYDAYLRARATPIDWGFAIKSDIESAIRLYEQAVELDPNFTLARGYLSIAQSQCVWKGIEQSPARAKIPSTTRLRSMRTFQKFTLPADIRRRMTRVRSQNFGRRKRVCRIALTLFKQSRWFHDCSVIGTTRLRNYNVVSNSTLAT